MRAATMIWATVATGLVLQTMTAPVTAQLLGGLPAAGLPAAGLPAGLGSGVGGLSGAVGGLTSGITGAGQGAIGGGLDGPFVGVGATLGALTSSELLSLRRDRLRALVRQNRATLDIDDAGNPIRRDTVVGIGMTADAIARAKAAGFALRSASTIDGLDLTATLLIPPKGKPAGKAIALLRAADPSGSYTLDHIYEPARAPLAPAKGGAAGSAGPAGGSAIRIGLIDGGVGSHPAFASASIQQRGFAGDARPSGHGTAVASLIVGKYGAFHGAAPGALLMVADIYGGSPANGSAEAIARAMGWLAQGEARVINISLVGPPNALLAAAVSALQRRGIIVVAAVGNDGPAAPPQYPASYPGVVAVTGVDGKGRALIEAGKPIHLDFAAPAADLVGAVPGGKWERLRGTSFAAPFVTARLALRGSIAAVGSEAQPGSGRLGRGIVCANCATAPKAVGLKSSSPF